MSVSINRADLGFVINESLQFVIEIHGPEEIYVSMVKPTTGDEMSIAVEPDDIDQILETVQRAQAVMRSMR